jgi:hypothetical protein
MTAISADDLRAILKDVRPAVPQPTWDFVVYARFLAARVPGAGSLAAPDFARLAEDLIGELKDGVDRKNGAVFDPPLVSGRADLVYNHFRAKLAAVAARVGGTEFGAAVTAGLVPVLPPARDALPPAKDAPAPAKDAPAPAKDAPAPA